MYKMVPTAAQHFTSLIGEIPVTSTIPITPP